MLLLSVVHDPWPTIQCVIHGWWCQVVFIANSMVYNTSLTMHCMISKIKKYACYPKSAECTRSKSSQHTFSWISSCSSSGGIYASSIACHATAIGVTTREVPVGYQVSSVCQWRWRRRRVWFRKQLLMHVVVVAVLVEIDVVGWVVDNYDHDDRDTLWKRAREVVW